MDTGRQIIEEAIRQFQDMGLRFTMQDVAQALHISKKTIYSAFASKEDLLIAMLDAGFEEIHKDKRAILESNMDLCDKIRTAMIAMPDQYQVIDFRMLSELNEKYPKAYACLVSHLENNWEPVTALLEEGMKQTCKDCEHCKPTYKGGMCELKRKKVKLSGTCEDWRKKK
jgi:AcrR family transcriptional regulator